MWLAFLDETGDTKRPDYFGACLAIVNSAFYAEIKRKAQKVLQDGGWDDTVEFKGSILFSATKGCPGVLVDKRVEMARQLLDLQIANHNARMKFYYSSCTTKDLTASYRQCVPGLLKKAFAAKANRKGDKDLVFLSCDKRTDINTRELYDLAEPVLARKGYLLLENVVSEISNTQSIGILYADLVAYLSARVETIASDRELFEGVTEEDLERSSAMRKLKTSKSLIARIKKLNRVRVGDAA